MLHAGPKHAFPGISFLDALASAVILLLLGRMATNVDQQGRPCRTISWGCTSPLSLPRR
jgi:hypothetical protein